MTMNIETFQTRNINIPLEGLFVDETLATGVIAANKKKVKTQFGYVDLWNIRRKGKTQRKTRNRIL